MNKTSDCCGCVQDPAFEEQIGHMADTADGGRVIIWEPVCQKCGKVCEEVMEEEEEEESK